MDMLQRMNVVSLALAPALPLQLALRVDAYVATACPP
jgi:hypothetical protein